MIDTNHFTNFFVVTENFQTNQLVVIPGIRFIGKNGGVCLNQQNSPNQRLSLGAIVNSLKENYRRLVVPTKFGYGYGFTKPWGLLRYLKF